MIDDPENSSKRPAGSAATDPEPTKVPFVSIVVPSLNQGRFMADCLRSIVEQIGASYEIILVDGGSEDETKTVVKPFRDALTHWICEPDKGQADAINKGLRLARGELVTWLNADDFLLPDALRRMQESATSHPAAPFYMGLGYRTDVSGQARTPFYPEGFVFNREALHWGLNFVLQPASFIRRAALAAVGGQVEADLHYAMDTDLWIRLSALGQPALVPYDIACSREHGETKTARGTWRRFHEIQRIAEQATGAALTPGVLAELMRLLHEQVSRDPTVNARLPDGTDKKIAALWAAASEGLRRLSGRDDGIPIKSRPTDPTS